LIAGLTPNTAEPVCITAPKTWLENSAKRPMRVGCWWRGSRTHQFTLITSESNRPSHQHDWGLPGGVEPPMIRNPLLGWLLLPLAPSADPMRVGCWCGVRSPHLALRATLAKQVFQWTPTRRPTADHSSPRAVGLEPKSAFLLAPASRGLFVKDRCQAPDMRQSQTR
jgi:hypothetical protein